MKALVLTVLLLLYSVLKVNSLKCYHCASTRSMEECSLNQVEKTCPGYLSTASCANVEVRYDSGGISVQAYSKACLSSESCSVDTNSLCGEEGVDCNIECCSDDLCNGEDSGEEGSSAELTPNLSCYECLSSTSMDDCIEHQKEKQCESGWTRCGTMVFHSTQMTGFRKGCITEELCKSFCASGPAGEEGIDQCELNCCEGNLCNAEFPSIGA